MSRRDEIKWAPFQSVINTKEVLKEIEEKKKIHEKPILSCDDLERLEKNILYAYHTKSFVKVVYYAKGMEYIKNGIITHLSKQNFKIYFDDSSSLYFDQILKVEEGSFFHSS